jgi:MazG family protein
MPSIGEEFERLLATMKRLRSEDGCPWDREQTMRSLRPFVLEEAHELVDAIDEGDVDAICEELGDVLLEVVFVTQIAAETRAFTMLEVVQGIREKLVRRHPHVFESRTGKAKEAGEALARWEGIKAGEKPHRESVLDGIPQAMPGLARALKLSRRAARAGFDWPSPGAVLDKVKEELAELTDAIESNDSRRLEEELGDMLFALANLARHVDVDPEISLRGANQKFSRRFRFIESRLAEGGRRVDSVNMELLEALWHEAKTREAETSND